MASVRGAAALAATALLAASLACGLPATAAPARVPRPATATAPKPAEPRVDTAALTVKLKKYLKTRKGHAVVSFQVVRTGQWYTYGKGVHTITASVSKVDVLAAVLLRHQRKHTAMTRKEKALATRMIHLSDNAAATALYDSIGRAAGLRAANVKLGLVSTHPSSSSWGRTTTTAADQIRLIAALTRSDSVLTKKSRDYVLHLMRGVTKSQRWGVSVAADKGTAPAIKNGWLPYRADRGRWVINSVGRVRIDEHLVAISVLTRSNPTMSYGVHTAEHVAGLVRTAVRAADAKAT